MSLSVEEAIAAFRSSEWTAMVVNPEGEIVLLVSRAAWPDTAFIIELNDRFPRAGFHLFQRGEYTPQDIRATIANILEGIRLMRDGLLRPGVNVG